MFPSDISTVTQSVATHHTRGASGFVQRTIQPNKLQFKPVGSPRVALSHLYSFFNESSVAIEQASNVHLNNFITYLLDNAESLRAKQNECLFSRWKYKRQELNHFFNFITTVTYLVKYSRDYYESVLKTTDVPFISVSHDGWDSKDNDVLGVSIHFILPVYWMNVSMAVGLKRVYSKTADNIVSLIEQILSR